MKIDFHLDILNQYQLHKDDLTTLFNKMEVLQFDKIIVSSPVNKYIIYSLETAINIILAHEKRHFWQAKNVLAMYEDVVKK